MTVVRIGGDEAPWEPGPDRAGTDPSDEPAAATGIAPAAELVLVTWRDAWFDFDEADPEETRADYLVRTVGFLVRRGPRFVSIAQEALPDDEGFRAITHIPVEVVASIVRVGERDETEERDRAVP